MSQIVWLASYPKSGNTWLRAFLVNFQADSGQPADIHALQFGQNAAFREPLDLALGIESSDMTAEEIERYRPQAYRSTVANRSETLFLKIHDAYTSTAGEPLVPADVTCSAI